MDFHPKQAAKTQNIKGYKVFTTTFFPESPPKAIVQINHGMAEHCRRYYDFAQWLSKKGYAVYLHDHPGHGETISDEYTKGDLPWQNGWDSFLDVTHAINKKIRKSHPMTPVFLFGHSMGSLIARYYNATYPMYFKGMILSGTGNPPAASLKSSLLLVNSLAMLKSKHSRNKWLNNFFYNRLNKHLKSPTTNFDWLTSEPSEVKAYLDDPNCGFHLSLSFYKNLLQGSLQMQKAENYLRFRKNFSTLIISGKQDVVGNFGKEPEILQQKYINQGYFNTHLRLIDGRHELLNEKKEIKKETYSIITNWIEDKLSGKF